MKTSDKHNGYQVFKGSSDSLTLDTPLWRYMTFEKFCWLLETSQLHHARLDQFDDPFEGSVTKEYARLRSEETEPSQIVVNKFEPWVHKSLLFRTYAACWHASPHESDAQWRIYAGGGAGIAVVSTMTRLARAVDIRPHRHGLLGEVEYVDLETHDMCHRPFGTRIRPGFAKRKSFEHEKEVRGVIQMDLITDGSTIQLNDKLLERQRMELPVGISATVHLKELIQSIVVGPLAAPFIEQLVRVTAKRHDLDHVVRKSELNGQPIY